VPAIHSLRPNVTQAEAIEKFRRGAGGLLHRLGTGGLRSVADVYVPFQVYEVEIVDGPRRKRSWFALDAVNGSLDLYHFEQLPAGGDLVSVETRNRPPVALGEDRALALLEDKLRRHVFQAGFFRVRDLRLRTARVPLDLHVPYWIGFYAAGSGVRLRVLDAVRSRFEGAKARALFEAWLAA
jgi:hypothetical protein